MKILRVVAALGSPLMVCGGATVAHAGECVDDWPNPWECFPDVLCQQYSDYWDVRRAVVHLYGPDIAGTGVLINNANCSLNDTDCGTPYLLTANHVVSGYLNAQMTTGEKNDLETKTAFTFGLEAATCGGPTATGAVAIYGAQVVAASPDTDLLLLKLATSLPPELGVYYVGWCDIPVDQAVSISHPCGAPKRIAVSDFGEIEFKQVVGRDVYDVYWWEDGALAGGSSGAPLLDRPTGGLRGIFTNTLQAGSEACSNPGDVPAQDRFTAMSSILEVLPTVVDGGQACIDHFDPSVGTPIIGTTEDSKYYGSGIVKEISATEDVWLVDGFFADEGSTVTITITDAP